MKKNLKAVLITLLIFSVLAALGIFSMQKDKVKEIPRGSVGNTAGNLNNKGLFCEYNGTVYFSNAYDSGALYSMKSDGTNIKKLNNAETNHICAAGDYLFYFQNAPSGSSGLGYVRTSHGLYRSLLNGKKAFCLSRDYVYDMQLVDNYIFYVTSSTKTPEFYKVKIDKSESLLIDKTATNPSCVVNGQIYYNNTGANHYLYALDPNTGSSSVIWDGNLWYPVYDNGFIYYLDVSNNYKLCRYSLTTNTVEILTQDRVDCFNVGYGYVYYQKNSATDPALMKMNTDGTFLEEVAKGNYTSINMTSKYVYCNLFGTTVPMYRTSTGSTGLSTFDAAAQVVIEK